MQNLSAGVRFRCLAKSQPEVRILIMGEIFRFQLRFRRRENSQAKVRNFTYAKSQAESENSRQKCEFAAASEISHTLQRTRSYMYTAHSRTCIYHTAHMHILHVHVASGCVCPGCTTHARIYYTCLAAPRRLALA